MKVSSPYVTKLLNHDVNLSFSTASKLANALGLDFMPVLVKRGHCVVATYAMEQPCSNHKA